MNKVVDGKEVEMGGTLDYKRNGTKLSHEMTSRDGMRGVWQFNWKGSHMTGTLKQLPRGEVVRNIALDKK